MVSKFEGNSTFFLSLSFLILKKKLYVETSSSDEESNLQAFDDRMLKKHKNSSSDRTCNGNVASDQEYRLDYQSMSSMGQMMGSSSQDSEPSDNEDSQPSIHKTYIKSKPVYDPVIDQKAKAMMVVFILISCTKCILIF